ncbi:hypothetical protein FPZ42_07230 [Mucilaginibacter achroorhodeus]|uniref:Uncharacterized protein n=1 Tax=Mucilaginibacter achroorhodeus TaxID=2599294 RepID=A0A563U669_9SPHI|nr:hypothetical protein [Mucilaginibacter achroorhodeus]TWR26823.1 hypothetical protein FPZ42_07230 [Mucilaginibacter achroorhodeus]
MRPIKEPVIYRIEQTSFVVDVEKQVLRQTDEQLNEISFINQMSDRGDHYLLAWDPATKNAAIDPAHGMTVVVPPLSRLDPEGMSQMYGVPLSELAGRTDFEIVVDPDALNKRRQGILPEIDIAGERFIIDLKLQELRHAANFSPVISLKSFELTDDGWHYEAFYEPVMKQVVDLDLKLTEFPNGIVKIKIPNEIGLDPVATARAYGMDERALLRRYPIPKELKAEVIPLSETQVPRLIRQNREQLRREHEAIKHRHQPGKQPRL